MSTSDNNTNVENTFFEEESSFDIIKWVKLCIHYWYVFVIGLVIAFAIAYYKNRSYMPQFVSYTNVLIRSANADMSSSFIGGFGAGAGGYSGMNNQILILKSYDLVGRTIDSLPQMQTVFYRKKRFKDIPQSGMSPIYVDTISTTSSGIYSYYYHYERKSDTSFRINVFDRSNDKKIEVIDGVFGEPIGTQYFLINVSKNDKYFNAFDNIYFDLKSKMQLVNEFVSRISIDKIEMSSVLRISLRSVDTYRDRVFLTQHMKSFLDDNLDKKNYEADRTIRFINDQLTIISDSLNKSEADLSNYKISSQMYGSNATSVLSSQMASLDDRGRQIKQKDAYFSYLRKYLKDNIEDGTLASPSTIGLQEPRLISLVDRYNDLQLQLMDLGPKNPQYEVVSNKIKQIKSQMSELITSITDIYKIEKNAYEKDVADLKTKLVQSPDKELAMLGYERKFKLNDNYYTFLLQKRSEAQIRKASNSPDNVVLQDALTGGIINYGEKKKLYIYALVLGLVIPLLLVILKEKLNMAIRTEDDVESATKKKFPVIGYIRHTKHKSDEQVIAAKYPNSFFVEQLRVIRTKIEIILQRHEKITMMVSSTESGDGKTYVSLNLAGVFALRSKNVLLIDFDIRKPNLTNTMSGKLSHNFGFVNYMIGDCTLDEAIETTSYGFDFLKAGAIPPNPGEFVRSPKMLEMFEELKSRYDYIIIDTSPLGLVADAYAIFPSVDIKLMIVRSFKTNKYEFSDLSKRLYQDNIKDVYVVLNDFDKSKSCYGYGYGYGYGMRKKIGNYYVTEEFEKDDMSLRERIFDKIQDLTKAIRNIRK